MAGGYELDDVEVAWSTGKAISELGDNVTRGATETNNSGTDAANAHIMTLSRAVNTAFPW